MAASRSVTLWDRMFCMLWSFRHALSRSLVASSTSLVVIWQSQLSNGLCKAMYSGILNRGRSLSETVLRVFRRRVSCWAFSTSLTVLPPLLRKNGEVWWKSFGRKKGKQNKQTPVKLKLLPHYLPFNTDSGMLTTSWATWTVVNHGDRTLGPRSQSMPTVGTPR